MSFDPRALVYPLEALRRREAWRHEALQADVARSSRLLERASEELSRLHDVHCAAAAAGLPVAAAAIDPVSAASRLAYLGSLLAQQNEVDRQIAERRAQRLQLQQRSEQQRTRLEAIERHRSSFVRQAAAQGERQERAEADRDWIARLPRPAGPAEAEQA